MRLQNLVNQLLCLVIDLIAGLDTVELFTPLVADDNVFPASSILAHERINGFLEVLNALLGLRNQASFGNVGEQIDQKLLSKGILVGIIVSPVCNLRSTALDHIESCIV